MSRKMSRNFETVRNDDFQIFLLLEWWYGCVGGFLQKKSMGLICLWCQNFHHIKTCCHVSDATPMVFKNTLEKHIFCYKKWKCLDSLYLRTLSTYIFPNNDPSHQQIIYFLYFECFFAILSTYLESLSNLPPSPFVLPFECSSGENRCHEKMCDEKCHEMWKIPR